MNENTIKADLFHSKVQKVMQLWSDWQVYDRSFLKGLHSVFNLNEDESKISADTPREIEIQIKKLTQKLNLLQEDKLQRECHINGVNTECDREKMIEKMIKIECFRLKKSYEEENKMSKEQIYESLEHDPT